ncbi:hypothetical protein BBG19_0373 [Francisella sp. MA067296]|nr:hypothetical protein BBG19_0373 [Francisella sp. MA067296]
MIITVIIIYRSRIIKLEGFHRKNEVIEEIKGLLTKKEFFETMKRGTI